MSHSDKLTDATTAARVCRFVMAAGFALYDVEICRTQTKGKYAVKDFYTRERFNVFLPAGKVVKLQ